MTLSLTEKAAEEVKRMMNEKKLSETAALRVGVADGGCAGYEYRMNFDEAPSPTDDDLSESHGVRIAVEKESVQLLDGTQIDFREDLLNRGFIFENPMAVKTCGCGTSFKA